MQSSRSLSPLSRLINDIDEARLSSVSITPHLFPIMASSKILITKSIPTAAVTTGYRHILVNPDFWGKLVKNSDKIAILIHETLHKALYHIERGEGKDPEIWNIVTDAFINEFIRLKLGEDNFAVKNGVTYEKIHELIIKPVFPNISVEDLKKLSEEELYYIVAKALKKHGKTERPEPGVPGGEGSGRDVLKRIRDEKWDKDDLSADDGEAEREKVGEIDPVTNDIEEPPPVDIKEKMRREILEDKMNKKFAGTTPGGETVYLEGLLPRRKLNWRTILAEMLRKEGGRSIVQTWKLPNRRYESLPAVKRYGPKDLKILFLIDVSGSISEKDLKTFIEESMGAIQDSGLNKENAYIVTWDSQVTGVFKLSELQGGLKITGRGGTVIDPALEYALNQKPDIVVVFTDGVISSTDKTRQLAEELKKKTKKSIFVYTMVGDEAFKNWIRMKYTPQGSTSTF